MGTVLVVVIIQKALFLDERYSTDSNPKSITTLVNIDE